MAPELSELGFVRALYGPVLLKERFGFLRILAALLIADGIMSIIRPEASRKSLVAGLGLL